MSEPLKGLLQHTRPRGEVPATSNSRPVYPQLRTWEAPPANVSTCEGFSDACRGWVCAANSVGRRPRSLRGGNRGGIRRGGAGGSVYGDLMAAGWLAGVAWSAGSRGSGQPRDRRGGVATNLRWRRRVLLGEVGARGGIEPSGAACLREAGASLRRRQVAGLGGRHAWRFWAG